MSAFNYKCLPFPPLPPTQAINSPTFKPPPLDGTLTLPEIYDWHYRNTPKHPLFLYPDGDGTVHEILWPSAVRAIHQVGYILRPKVGNPMTQDGRPIVAVLAASDTITYFTVTMGIVRAGFAAFPISPRNSPAAVAHLLAKIKVSHVLVGAENALQELIKHALEMVPENSSHMQMNMSSMPTFEELYIDDDDFKPLSFERPDMDDPAIILHSSGSTAFPKPVIWTHYRMLQLGLIPYFGERDLTGKRLSCHAMPMFHGMGIMQTAWTAASGLVIAAFKPSTPATVPTPDSVFKGALDSRSDIIFCVPSFAEAWSKDPMKGHALREIDGILYGGGPLSKEAGDNLTSQGVSVLILYGCTEGGVMSSILPKTFDKDWEYFRISPHIKSYFVPDGHGHYEFVMIAHPYNLPCVLNTKIDGVDGYTTNDLLSPHPTKTGYWRIHGRADDQIMHNTGEKTNPGPLESIMNRDPYINAAVMFGRGRFNAGVLIDPSPMHRFDPRDTDKLVAFRNLIWPTLEYTNQYAPQHSRIFKEMILVASPSKPFTYTAKNTARRQAILAEYEAEIQALYDSVDETTQANIPLPSDWSYENCIGYVRTVVKQVLERLVLDGDDLFQHGCDSLQATWIRNSLLHALRETQCNVRNLSSGIVYANPSIARLATFISNHASSSRPLGPRLNKVSEMEEMVNKYNQNLPLHVPTLPAVRKDTIVLTGSTGGLGAVLLAQLLDHAAVEKVYGINRKSLSDGSLIVRQRKVFEERGLDTDLLESPKLVLVEADVNGNQFKLPPQSLEEIRNNCTHIIHNAYTVDFNMVLQSFEPHVRGIRNLIDLALSSRLPSPPRLLFISSVSVVRNMESSMGGTAEEIFVDASAAEGSGYSESKWACERLLAETASRTELRPIIIRVGQVSGSANGTWKVTDWVPCLIRSSVHLGCLPDSEKSISWIPADAAAASILQMRNAWSPVLHLASPKPVAWRTVFTTVSEMLGLPLVSYSAWMDKLEESNNQKSGEYMRKNPALLLMDFFRSARLTEGNPGKEAMGLPKLSLTRAVEVSEVLRETAPLTATDVQRWVEYWKRINFVPA
ncbi:acetyl-CoA synthetase-like protein [Neolentinus lepideus HHB14362 ss-1]|uniref:Acetyl-CoA synthetase-like protein n=1 Tax=Neolentinus lepideus HHB14362 ss-1 TaxID=1314782 RepID=A0A165UT84_9AGAM|nr:acetyl-CoA synthetase-like protein [Neolentinus lepideus HHB14362 ss-1]